MRWCAATVFFSLVLTSVPGVAKTKKKAKVANTGVPSCKDFKCSAGQREAPKESFTPRSYGCLEIPRLDKCCVERDVCMQTCGMRSKSCFKNFADCSARVCGSDTTCVSNAKVLGEATGGRDDKELCTTYIQSQQGACDCVSKYVWKGELNKRLVDFYKKHQPEKLDISGRLRDADRIWQKWEGNESSLFLALTMKYWDKAVDLREKPGQTARSGTRKGPSPSGSKPRQHSRSASPAPKKRPSRENKKKEHTPFKSSATESEFAKNVRVLESQMRAAAKQEDYITARELQVQVQELREKEILRLEYAKERAVKSEDFALAKQIKAEQAELRSEVQKATKREESARKQAETPPRANIDRVGSRVRLERDEDLIVGVDEARDSADSQADESYDKAAEEPDEETEETIADESEVPNVEDEL